MAEKVSTGGTREFIYSGEKPSLSNSEKQEIRDAYDKYYERKKIEKKKKSFIILLIILIILIALFFAARAIF